MARHYRPVVWTILWFIVCSMAALLPVRHAHALTIYVDEANPPFMYRSDDQAEGIYPDIVRAVFARAGISVKIIAVPWRRALMHLENGDGGIAGIYKNLERQKRYAFSDPIHREGLMIYRPKTDFAGESDLDDLEGMSVGVIRGWSYGDAFDSARRAGLFSASEATGDDQNFSMLISKRIDAVIAVREAGDIWIKKLRLEDQIVRAESALFENQTFIALNRRSKDLSKIALINRAIAEMVEDGTFDSIVTNALRQAIGSAFH
ncbi:ABC transporter substrate-binding protein [Thalassospira profundimaris]|nr:transporter substrate-binding domain-containing protein [Thalassospira profundimaris]